MTLATVSGIVASIVAVNLISGVATVASAMVALFVLVMVGLAVAPLVSSDGTTQPAASSTAGAEPSDD